MRRGEIRLCRFAKPDKRRPVLLLTRDSVLGLLDRVTVAPITRTRRGVPSELPLGAEDGLKDECAANFLNVITVPKSEIGALVCALGPVRMEEACRALAHALGCAPNRSK